MKSVLINKISEHSHKNLNTQSSGYVKLFGLSILCLILISSFASAFASGVVAGAAAVASSSRQREQQSQTQNSGGCMPPIEFAEKHECKLYYRSYEVAGYDCRSYNATYRLQGDCKGGATILYESHTIPLKITKEDIIFFSIPIGLFILLISIRYIRKQGYG